MKKIVLNCSHPCFFLTEIPPILLLAIAIAYNGRADNLLKLYPLIIASIAAIIFIALYFFRLILIKTDEVVQIGRFSSRDRAMLDEGKTLILTLMNKNKIKIEVFGSDGQSPAFDWLAGEDAKPVEFYLFRGRALGGARAASKILQFFGTPKDDCLNIINSNDFKKDYEQFTVTTSEVNSNREIRIKFTQTI